MGHDIYVSTEKNEELHYARFSLGVASIGRVYYWVFDAAEHHNGCSGDGGMIQFDRHEFKAHLMRYQSVEAKWTEIIQHFVQGGEDEECVSVHLVQITESIDAIKKFFQRSPPVLSDHKYFLIKNIDTTMPADVIQNIAAFASNERYVAIEFR